MDLFKLSHHGSRAHVTQELLRAVQAEHYVLSTNGAIFNHPNDEAVARVIVGTKRPTLWFNYDTPHTRQWAAEGLTTKYDYTVRYPISPGTDVILELPLGGSGQGPSSGC